MTNTELYTTIALAVLLITDVVVFLVYYVKLKRFMRITNKSLELTEKIWKTELEMLDLHQEHLQKHDKMFSLLWYIIEEAISEICKKEEIESETEHDSDFAQYMIDKLLDLVTDISENDKTKTEKANQEANKSHKKKSHVKKNEKN